MQTAAHFQLRDLFNTLMPLCYKISLGLLKDGNIIVYIWICKLDRENI